MRIVSLAPGITETLFAIGCGDSIVGRTSYCDLPDAAKSIPVVGGFSDCGREAVAERKPDLVIGMSLHGRLFAQLHREGIRTATVEALPPRCAEEMVRSLGRITGCEAAAQTCAERLGSSIRAIQDAAPKQQPIKVCYLCDIHCPNWSACTIADAVTGLNCYNIGRGRSTAAPDEIVRDIVESKPQLLLVPDEHADDAEPVMETHPVMKEFMNSHHPEIRCFSSKRLARTGSGSAEALRALFTTIYSKEISEPC